MSQTLLAVGALALLAFLALNERQSGLADDERAVGIQTVAVANRVAVDALNRLRRLPFDAGSVAAPATAPGQLLAHPPLEPSPAARFGALGSRSAAAAARPGTLAGADGEVRVVEQAMPAGAARFEVATVVGYVAADGATPSATPTPMKQATVRVRPLDWEAPALYVSQLYPCGAACDW